MALRNIDSYFYFKIDCGLSETLGLDERIHFEKSHVSLDDGVWSLKRKLRTREHRILEVAETLWQNNED